MITLLVKTELQDVSKELLSHMQGQTKLMELLVKNQQQGGLQNVLHAPFGEAPVATNQVQVPGAQHLFVPGAPFCAPFFGSQPLAVPGVVQPLCQPMSVPVGKSSAGTNGLPPQNAKHYNLRKGRQFNPVFKTNRF